MDEDFRRLSFSAVDSKEEEGQHSESCDAMQMVSKIRPKCCDAMQMEEEMNRIRQKCCEATQMEENFMRLSFSTVDLEEEEGQRSKALKEEGQRSMVSEEVPEEALHSPTSMRLLNAYVELSQLLSPHYCRLAFTLPPTSTTIWNIVENDIDCLAQKVAQPCPKDPEDVLHFMEYFFATPLVRRMRHSFGMLEGSYLGIAYTFRLGLAGLAEMVLGDLIDLHICKEDSPLSNFLGACAEEIPASLMVKLEEMVKHESEAAAQLVKGDDWITPKKTFKATKGHGVTSGGSGSKGDKGKGGGDEACGGGPERCAGSTGDGGDDDGEGSENQGEKCFDPTGLLNDTMIAVDVWLSEFKTPPKGPNRKQVLSARSLEFEQKGAIMKPEFFHNPWFLAESQPSVLLFHGTRSSSLKSFNEDGISPPVHRNEFSRFPAFYACNSLRYAYEHPLHNHLVDMLDPVSVMVFEVDARVLHGEAQAPGMERPFLVKWFEVDTEESIEEWADFSLGNLKRRLKQHKYDIVIGPVCIPNPSMDYVDMLQRDVGGGVELTQIAFCSLGSQEWLAKCARIVYCEKLGGRG